MISIKDYLKETKYITQHLIEMISTIETHKNQVLHNKEMIPRYIQEAQIYNKFSKAIWADGAEEEFSDLRQRSLEKFKVAGDLQTQLFKIEELYNNALLILNSPLQSVSQALLQIAKQGISSEYGRYKSDCSTKLINAGISIACKYNVSILDIIWEGRNQSIHYEEASPFSNVRNCFEALIQNQNHLCQALLGYDQGENKAYEIVKILDWSDILTFERDLLSLSQ